MPRFHSRPETAFSLVEDVAQELVLFLDRLFTAGIHARIFSSLGKFVQLISGRPLSASEAKQRLATLLDMVAREPVVIRRQKRDVAVVLSIREYERLVRLNVSEFQQFCEKVGAGAKAAGLTDEKLSELLVDD